MDKWYREMVTKVSKTPGRYPLWLLDNGKLYKHARPTKYPELADDRGEWLIVAPKEQRKQIIRDNHDPPTCGHLGIFKTVARITEKYYWPKLRHDVAKYIGRCRICLVTKPERKLPAGKMLSATTTISRPWELISTDIVGPLPRSSSGYSFILSVVDCFSKYCLFFPLRTANAQNVTKIIEDNVILVYGAPVKLISDNGTVFRSRLFRDMLQNYGIQVGSLANYHAQANPVERTHQVLETMLRAYIKNDAHRHWDKELAKVACAMRSSRHEVTGLTPNFINFGREIQLNRKDEPPVSDSVTFDLQTNNAAARSQALSRVFKDVRELLKKSYERAAKRYNLRRRDERFQVGQKVWKRNYVLSDASKKFTAKLAPKFSGPYEIMKVVSPWSYELADDMKSLGIWHAKDIKAHPPDEES